LLKRLSALPMRMAQRAMCMTLHELWTLLLRR